MVKGFIGFGIGAVVGIIVGVLIERYQQEKAQMEYEAQEEEVRRIRERRKMDLAAIVRKANKTHRLRDAYQPISEAEKAEVEESIADVSPEKASLIVNGYVEKHYITKEEFYEDEGFEKKLMAYEPKTLIMYDDDDEIVDPMDYLWGDMPIRGEREGTIYYRDHEMNTDYEIVFLDPEYDALHPDE